jgi:hypothetical protein
MSIASGRLQFTMIIYEAGTLTLLNFLIHGQSSESSRSAPCGNQDKHFGSSSDREQLTMYHQPGPSLAPGTPIQFQIGFLNVSAHSLHSLRQTFQTCPPVTLGIVPVTVTDIPRLESCPFNVGLIILFHKA